MARSRVNYHPKVKKAAAVAYHEVGMPNIQIQRTLGIGNETVLKWIREGVDDEWQDYKNQLKKAMLQFDTELGELAATKIRERLEGGNDWRLSDAVFLYKTARELQFPEDRRPDTKVQVNNIQGLVVVKSNDTTQDDQTLTVAD